MRMTRSSYILAAASKYSSMSSFCLSDQHAQAHIFIGNDG